MIYLEGSNALVTHRYRTMLDEEGIVLDTIDDYADPGGTTLNLEEEVNRRRLVRGNEKLTTGVSSTDWSNSVPRMGFGSTSLSIPGRKRRREEGGTKERH